MLSQLFPKGYEYGRSGNPNRDSLEKLLASLEAGGSEAIAFSSGSAATSTILQGLGPNAHIVCVSDVYGGTFRYMTRVGFPNQGLQTTFVDLENATEDEIYESIREDTKVSRMNLHDSMEVDLKMTDDLDRKPDKSYSEAY